MSSSHSGIKSKAAARPVVWIVGTGGTIASKYDPVLKGHVAAASASELAAAVPRLSEFADIHAMEHSRVNSPSLDTATVFALRDVLKKLLAQDEVAGVVVTHGTATLEETAYLLDLTLDTDKPVVVTGSQRDFDEADADGPRNLLDSVRVVANPASAGRGVLVVVGGEIHAAREVFKSHSYSINAFASRDGGRIGMVFKDGVIYFSRPERRIHLPVDHVETGVHLIVMTQGSDDLLLRACISGRAKGIIIDGVGAGNMNLAFYHAACDALEGGIPVVISSRHLAGPPHLSKGYPGSLASVVARGGISAGYMSGIKARILLMVALAHTRDRGELADIFARA